ncbi:hypothetical protein AVEN_111461-1 [Araneus ventricosus]|uniref:Reverse transcriptase domain-containing protein n=1 Tax=Araneus ventricosus TaxID=182803 RepID=A0A4Y2K0R8_ARAVE|nr:hypothetical protein AVEN_111461-1 [Araneus ventricosus]
MSLPVCGKNWLVGCVVFSGTRAIFDYAAREELDYRLDDSFLSCRAHLLKHNKISAHQYGFTPARSAPQAIIQLKDWIAIARSQKKHRAITSLDVKSAFSRVWRPLVLHNLKRMACPRNLFNMTASFLGGRSISFKYGGTVSTKEYSIGCSQGSNSGPLYWLLIVNDALEMDFGEDVQILAYADDIYLFVAATRKQNVKKYAESALQKLQDWNVSAKNSSHTRKRNLFHLAKTEGINTPRTVPVMEKPLNLPDGLKFLELFCMTI